MEAIATSACTDAEISEAAGAAFRALGEAGIAWCVLRGEGSGIPSRNDVDLFVSPHDAPRLGQVLAEAGFVWQPQRSRHRFFLNYDASGDRWLVLDVVHELVYGPGYGLRLGRSDDVLARRDRSTTPPLLHPEDRFWTFLLHQLLDRNDLPLHAAGTLRELAGAVSSPSGPLAEAVDGASGPPWTADFLHELACGGKWSDLRSATRQLVRRTPRSRRAWKRIARPLGRLVDVYRRQGLTVAILGPDGAGKSTLANALAGSWGLPARIVYMGMQQGSSTPGKVWRPPAGYDPRRRRPLHRRLVGLVRAMGRFVRGSLVARYHRTFGRLVIFDRFVYDTRVNWERTTGVGPRLRMWLLHRASLRPDFVVLIDVPGQTMFDRKGEHDVELLEKRRWRYLELAEGLPGVIVVDGTLPPDQVRRTVTAELWARYAARTQKGHPRIG